MTEPEQQPLKLEGVVDRVLFFNATNGYIVLELETEQSIETVVGELGEIEDGETLLVMGQYISHSKFGMQFRAEYCERKLPSTAENIRKYLSSGVISGIGPSLAKRIVDVFGDKTLEIMEQHPEQLASIKGISQKKCQEIAREVQKIFTLRSLMTYLSQYRIPARYAMKAFQQWGVKSRDVIDSNPYSLCSELVGLPFQKAEVLARSLRISMDSEQRILAGIQYLLTENTFSGHTCLPLDRLQPLACRYLGIGEQAFYSIYNQALEEQTLYEYKKGEREFVYLPEYYIAESYIADRIQVILAFSSPEDYDFDALIDLEEQEKQIRYEALQRKAITTALSRGLMVLTGGPGTGKTTTLNAIISLYEKQGKKVMIAAPTGRAAKRISDLTGYEAKTIHRLLEVQFDSNERLSFKHNEKDPLDCDVLVVDEMSMVDVLLFEHLLRALKLHCRMVLVGDSDQLPSVGAGNLLRDLIDGGSIPVIALQEIFRQAQKSCIVTNAHRIVRGEDPDLMQKQSDFFFLQRLEPEPACELVISLCRDRLPKAYGFDPLNDIQVIAPARKGTLGVIALNQALQNALNPKQKGRAECKTPLYTFRVGDKVMQTRNNYDILWKKDGEQGTGIFNGDIGRILEINRAQMMATIDFDGRITPYPLDQLDQLELAYAITVHKSQGSEFEAVVIPILGGFEKLYYRNLLYTAVTRAKKLLILVGSRKKIEEMVHNNRRTNRYSCLRHMLMQNEQASG
ncbi:ATP-dependent RecD-like DNA helicase [Ruminococcus sp.]|uniref:SF1B family DNA helicase RecD2 n=1 Tax=Ruminococcus sp. TaxID=41978 RepID=UPI0025D4A718|nr:ATP-dependent RecD-like DNA helicase [Ruminococcus sp.]MCI5817150.1 ATP-dependent RecD-like DNA helicase [Ruminococcus sp.]